MYIQIIHYFFRAIKVLDDQGESHAEKPEELQKLVDMRLKCYNNLAAAQLKVSIYKNITMYVVLNGPNFTANSKVWNDL